MAHLVLKLESDSDEDEAIFRPRSQLRKPVHVLRSLNYFMRGLNNGSIDVDPDYQREVVWSADRMSGLINSLMENFYIPPVIMNRKTDKSDERKQLHVCVDGKQRLTSVKLFIQGGIPCRDRHGEKWFFTDKDSNKRKKNILPETVRQEFLKKEFVSIEYSDILPEQEEDLFARVQMGIPLTPAEKLRASSGPWQELARRYVDDFPAIYQLLKDVSHAKDFQITLECFSQILEAQKTTPINGTPTFKCSVHQAVKFTQASKDSLDDATKSHLAHVWNIFQELLEMDPITFNNADKHLHGVQTFAPLEMVAITVLISRYSETRSARVLLEYVQAIRTALREEYRDLKINGESWRFVWRWLSRPPHHENSDNEQGTANRQDVVTEPARRSFTKTLAYRQNDLAMQESNEFIPDTTKDRPTKKRRIGSNATISLSPELPTTSTNGSNTARDTLPLNPASASSKFAAPYGSAPAARKATVLPKRTSIALSSQSPQDSHPQAQPSLPLTPSEIRQNRISESNSYRAPLAPMGHVAPFASVGPHARQENQTPAMPRRKIIKIKSSWTQPKPTSPTIPQVDGTVDQLHNNGGRERDSGPELLASFHPRTMGERQPRTVAEQSSVRNDFRRDRAVNSTGEKMDRRRIIGPVP